MELNHRTIADLVWLALAGMTLVGALVGESAATGHAITFVVAFVIAAKGRLVVDHFMELRSANSRLHRLMAGYFHVIPLLVVLTDFFGDGIARLTSL